MNQKGFMKDKDIVTYAIKVLLWWRWWKYVLKNCKVRDECHYMGKDRGAAHNDCNLRYKMRKEIPIVFHNGSMYDYHFMIEKLTKAFKGKIDCIRENTEKYITFEVPLKKKAWLF